MKNKIDCRELMIGNYILNKGIIQKISSIRSNRIETMRANQISDFPVHHFYLDSDWITPIPLTEEILLKCGFVKSNDLDMFYHLIILNEWTRIYFNLKHKVFILSINEHDSVIKIYYLHQLQNLYKCLCGNDLEIKLD